MLTKESEKFMNLKFYRNLENDTIDTNLVKGEGETPFDYASLIKYLYQGESLTDCEYDGEFDPHEMKAIGTMVESINRIVMEYVHKEENAVKEDIETEGIDCSTDGDSTLVDLAN